ncbi:hypothetical protein LQR30_02140 [Chromobacterium piscinae]|uniref:hypothetical protein n=1 Tax=Chromobacterium piscinae TaxID=686831 RepID=UPI001E43E6F6|nr:hypothetical protein [Chromobacterium piscinae]MCD4502893.1 hypothetical protein [Chromobacterium piscinae]
MEHIEEIHKAYIGRAGEAKANIARLKAAKLDAQQVETTYDLLLSIGSEYKAQ